MLHGVPGDTLAGLVKENAKLKLQISELQVTLANEAGMSDKFKAQLDTANRLVGAMQEIVDAAMNENMPRLRAATKAYQTLTQKRNASSPICFWCREAIKGDPYIDKFDRTACMSHKELIEAMSRPVR